MRWLSIVTAVLLSSAALADDLVPLDEAQLAARAARMTLFVTPAYPPSAAREGVEATVDVIGTVLPDGALGPARFEVKPDREDFRKAVEEVMPFWMLYPGYDDTCHYQPVEGQVRVWFEIKNGKPAVSFSMPRKLKDATSPPGAPQDIYRAIHKVELLYPRGPQRAGREGSVIALLHVPDTGEVENVVLVPGRHNADFGLTVYQGLKRWRFSATPRPKHCFEYTVEFRLK
jgi:TonB family protein